MKIPSKIKIEGHVYPIRFEDRKKKSGTDACGTSNIYSDMGIWIDSKMGKTQQESTLIHEIIEVINSLNEMGLTEAQICVFETGLYQTLKESGLLK